MFITEKWQFIILYRNICVFFYCCALKLVFIERLGIFAGFLN